MLLSFFLILIVGIMEDETLIQLGNRIRKIRLEKKLTQAELAERCSCNRNYISMLERGERNPSLEIAIRLAHYLKVPVEDIFQVED